MTLKLLHDPRTVARDVPGLFDVVFPQLTPGVVAYFNRTRKAADVNPVATSLIAQSKLQKAMLFELGSTVGEMLLEGRPIDWDECRRVSVARQRRYFDADIPEGISDLDRSVAEKVGHNIASIVSSMAATRGRNVTVAPQIPGLHWISSGRGDFAAGPALIEVKCTNKNFSSADYRQIVMYWLLGYAASIENRGQEWPEGVLLNPRLAQYVVFDFDELIHVIGAGRTKVEILQVFASMVGDRGLR
ncbi:hypothetical protein AYM40_21045 [Paraburkholderia phytofirmans OLGA172]|uniref:Uncharacterized protein n=1 Tax=Paraburkholderia phytofirmans OLGA172 TaxID=1417228 RepID=A0A160FQ01_9BURK|nr:hypothetical protein [Paraburkholderia phytofirmans]ANB74940.1 hypothetical protein AYM40_21045 [Paraburkholderia phytofirmans OLGA172]